jgi:hypothetical protein
MMEQEIIFGTDHDTEIEEDKALMDRLDGKPEVHDSSSCSLVHSAVLPKPSLATHNGNQAIDALLEATEGSKISGDQPQQNVSFDNNKILPRLAKSYSCCLC